MPWNPKFKLLPVTAFIPNLKTVFERDYDAALVYYAGAETLRGLQAINTARQLAEQWPVLNLLPFGGDPKIAEDGARVDESQRILCEWETASRVPSSLALHLVTYVTAGRSVLYEMSKADLTADVEQGQRRLHGWDVSTERYGERFYEAENKWTMVGSVLLTIRYTEGKANGN